MSLTTWERAAEERRAELRHSGEAQDHTCGVACLTPRNFCTRVCLSCALTCQMRAHPPGGPLQGLGEMLGVEGGPAACMRFGFCTLCRALALGALGSPPAERPGPPVCPTVMAAGTASFHNTLRGDCNF